MALMNGLNVILCCLPFGSAPVPSEFCLVSESAFDLANNLSQNPFWDPEELNYPLKGLIPEKDDIRSDLLFAETLPLDMDMPTQPDTKVDGYIEYAHTTSINDEPIFERVKEAFPLALGVIFRKLIKDEPITREEILQKMKMKMKMKGGGMPSKLKIFLGWLIDSRLFSVSLPEYKGNAWMLKITDLLGRRKPTSLDKIELLIGKLNHTRRNKGRKDMERDIPQEVMDDLALWLKFLSYAMKGISINLIAFRKPTFWSCLGACE
eukprot:15362475-Ditylum_brightwellii.AAC.3